MSVLQSVSSKLIVLNYERCKDVHLYVNYFTKSPPIVLSTFRLHGLLVSNIKCGSVRGVVEVLSPS